MLTWFLSRLRPFESRWWICRSWPMAQESGKARGVSIWLCQWGIPWSIISMDWFKGKFTGEPHRKNGKIYGFRFRFSLKPIHWLSHNCHLNGRFFSNPPFVFWVALFEPFLRQSQAWVNLLGLAQQIHIWTVLFINHACWGPFDLCLFFLRSMNIHSN